MGSVPQQKQTFPLHCTFQIVNQLVPQVQNQMDFEIFPKCHSKEHLLKVSSNHLTIIISMVSVTVKHKIEISLGTCHNLQGVHTLPKELCHDGHLKL